MKNRSSSGVIEDIWMNTQVEADDFGRIDPTAPDKPASWEEIEEENVLINPDARSMDDRG